jgi:hypothetical protein
MGDINITSINPNSGLISGGNKVIINGNGFKFGVSITVYFGTLSTIATVISSRSLSCIVPASTASTVDVTLNNGTHSDTLSNAYTYANPLVISSIESSNGPITGNSAVTIRGNNFETSGGKDITVNFGTKNVTSIVVNNTSLTCITPSGIVPGNVIVHLTNDYGTYNSTVYYTYNALACFHESTKILTNKGYVCIKELRKGDLIKTYQNDFKKIDTIGYTEIYISPKEDQALEIYHIPEERIKDQLYKCCKEFYPELFEDLIITGRHCILVDNYKSEYQENASIEVNETRFLINNKYRLPSCIDERTIVYKINGKHIIYHIALDNENDFETYGIYANGLLVETCSKNYLNKFSNMKLIE